MVKHINNCPISLIQHEVDKELINDSWNCKNTQGDAEDIPHNYNEN